MKFSGGRFLLRRASPPPGSWVHALDSKQVHSVVTVNAQRNQIVFHITSGMASEKYVVYLQVMHAAEAWHRQPSRSTTCP